MTTYTAITDTDTGFEKPITISLMRRLRDNPLAIQQGDATAPNILLGVAAKTALSGIGTYAFCRYVGGSSPWNVTAGTNYAGGGLRYTDAASTSGFGTPSGTWKAMASAASTVGGSEGTLFVRIS